MNYHNITTDDMLNGAGLRVVLWVAGCGHRCQGCQNPQTWDVNSGIPFGDEDMIELCYALSKDYIAGLTLSGGDPLFQPNIDQVTEIISDVSSIFPSKTVWVYTGARFEDVKDLPVMQMIDVLVDGEYVAEKRDVNTPWVGSTNQRVIDVRKSLAEGQTVLWEDK